MKWKFWLVFLTFAAFPASLLLEKHRAHRLDALPFGPFHLLSFALMR